VVRQIDDARGPGCGWAFTGQVAPVFDAVKAEGDFVIARKRAERRMAASWVAWQDAKFAYYADHAQYRADARAYRAYAEGVAVVSAAWAVVESARASYFAAVAEYEAAVEVAEVFEVDRLLARETFRVERAACAERANEPAPAPTPTPTPTPDGSGKGKGGDKSSEVVEPEETLPAMVCPPVRPDILSQERPGVPPVPVPSDEAQLPQGTVR
jgi:hypothetical protein